jgi:AcrR family transcriptional regulator
MSEDDDSVNMKPKRYHHGDLRRALLEAGLAILAARDLEGLSLREVARAVGVSATAVYRHFPDKQALMSALALEGLAQLSAAQHAAADAAGGGAAGFAASGRAYVRFALAHPALFRLIFASPVLADGGSEPGGRSTAARTLKANAPATPAAIAGASGSLNELRAWAMVHGLAMLMLDGQVPAQSELIDAAIDLDAAASRSANRSG